MNHRDYLAALAKAARFTADERQELETARQIRDAAATAAQDALDAHANAERRSFHGLKPLSASEVRELAARKAATRIRAQATLEAANEVEARIDRARRLRRVAVEQAWNEARASEAEAREAAYLGLPAA